MSFYTGNLGEISQILSNPTWDVIAVLFFVAVGFFYGISVGKDRLVAVLFALYSSKLLFDNFEFIDFFVEGRPALDIFLFRAFAFVILAALLSFLFVKTIFRDRRQATKAWWQVFLLSFLEVGLFISIVFTLLPNLGLFEFSPLVQLLFASPDAFFWWLALPLPALFLIMRRS